MPFSICQVFWVEIAINWPLQVFSGAVTCSDGLSTNTLTVNGNPAVTASTGTVSLTVDGAE